MDFLLSSLWSALEIWTYCLICQCFFQSRASRKQLYVMFIILWLVGRLYLNTSINVIFQKIITLVCYLSVSYFIYKGKCYLHIVAFLLWYALNGAIDTAALYGSSALLGISVSELILRRATYILVVTLGKILSLVIAWLLGIIGSKRFLQPTKWKWLVLSLLFPALSILLLWELFRNMRETTESSGQSLLMCIILFAANVAVFYFIGEMEKSADREKELALLHRQMEIQSSSIQTLETRYRAQREATHVFRSQLQTISGLLAQQDTDGALKYVEQILGEQTLRIFPINSRNSLLDALLNQKYQTATEQSIDVQFQVSDLSQLPLEMDKMVVLLSNLLDNAIEGCCRVDGERVMRCRVTIEEDLLHIFVGNSSIPVTIAENAIPTSKEPKEEHGYGLPQIRYIINDFHGTYALDYQEGWFAFVSEIPLEPGNRA